MALHLYSQDRIINELRDENNFWQEESKKFQWELEAVKNNLIELNKVHDKIPVSPPTKGRVTSNFGYRRHPISRNYSLHQGIDIASTRNTSIYSTAEGKVVFSGRKVGYGKTIIVDHGNGYKTLYAHVAKLLVCKGETVKQGAQIAKMGSTGKSTSTHLHYEISYKGKQINPINMMSM